MRLIADVCGADTAPETLAAALVTAAAQEGVELILCGNGAALSAALGSGAQGVRIEHAPQVIDMDDTPMSAVKSKKDSSMSLALRLLRDGAGDAVLSAGNTGALLTGASVLVGRMDGVKCAAIGAVLPFTSPTLLLDAGASLNPLPENLVQFALLGSVYMESLFGLERARVGLVNNGAEENKGTALYREAYALLSKEPSLQFIGNVEGRDIPFGNCDVLLCDGFVGNLLLKLSEGFGFYLSGTLKQLFMQNLSTKFAAFLLRKNVRALRKKLDYTEYGGAPLLGIAKPVIKAHGSSTPKAIASAVRQAKRFAESDFAARAAAQLAPKETL